MAVTRYGTVLQNINNYQDNLNGAITDVATAIIVDDASALPTVGDFTIQIESEYIIIESRSGNTLTARERGAEGTTAVAHSDGVDVKAVLTAEGLRKYLFAGRGPVFDDTTTTAAPLNRMLDESNTILTSSDFTWLNQGTATVTDDGGRMIIGMPSEANHSLRGLYLTAPTATYNIKCRVGIVGAGDYSGGASSHFGLMLYDNSAGEIITMSARYGEQCWMAAWDDTATFNSFVDDTSGDTYSRMEVRYQSQPIWLKMRVTAGGDVEGYISYDGLNWSRDKATSWQDAETTIYPSGGTTESVGIYCNSGNSFAGARFVFEAFTVEEE